MECEIVVVGSGPTGAATAADLALKGHDVLLLDRQSFPRDKSCGDAVPAVCIEWLWELGMRDRLAAAVDNGDFREVRTMRLVSPGGHVLDAAFSLGPNGAESYIAPRLIFDDIVLRGALDAGARFQQAHVRDVIFDEDKVVGVKIKVGDRLEEVRAKVVIGADGVGSIVARKLKAKDGHHQDLHRAVALRAYIEGFDEHPYRVEFYLLKEILPGYAWIFPLGNGRANIGLGLRLDVLRQRGMDLNEMLERFVQIPMISERLSSNSNPEDILTWPLNLGSQPGLQSAFNGAVLVGDAAGFINPLSGGGFKNCFTSARLAASTIHKALSKNDTSKSVLQEYDRGVHKLMDWELRYSYLVQRALLRFPMVADVVVGSLGGSRLLSGVFLRNM